jgi:hypothetical protein
MEHLVFLAFLFKSLRLFHEEFLVQLFIEKGSFDIYAAHMPMLQCVKLPRALKGST